MSLCATNRRRRLLNYSDLAGLLIQRIKPIPSLEYGSHRKRKRKVKAMKKTILLVLTVLFTISAWAQAPAVGSGRYDQQIQQEVNKVLSSNDKWQGITASVEDGIVTLQGTTKILIDKLDLQKKISKLDHVQGVRNQVQVATTVPDDQLQK